MKVNVTSAQLAQAPVVVEPGQFEASHHYYERVLNAQLHPLVRSFVQMSNERIVARYCHLHPTVNKERLGTLLGTCTDYLKWGGADLFYVTSEEGLRSMVVIETNSCPSGNKSMPIFSDDAEMGGYQRLLERAFLPLLKKRAAATGELAVLYDKNPMEASGYAAALAELTNRPVFYAPFADGGGNAVSFQDGRMVIQHNGEVVPIQAAFRYVTQKPWNRLPVRSKTRIFNPVVACLAGGRNKLMASKAYEFFQCRYSLGWLSDSDAQNDPRCASGRNSAVGRTVWRSCGRQSSIFKRWARSVHDYLTRGAAGGHGYAERI